MEVIKRLYLGIVILSLCSAILLISDWHSRQVNENNTNKKNIALLKFSSNLLLDEAEDGYIKRLAQRGYRDGDNITIKRFCPEGDTAAHNIIAKQITDGSFDLISSISTLSLQAVANANKDGKAIHVFNTVTDPAGAGVGIKSLNSLDKPPYMTGIGTFQPVEEIFTAIKKINPDVKNIGVIWNAAETNSEACVRKARIISNAMGINLSEAAIETSRDLGEAAHSLIARGIDAFWVGCDNIVNTSIPIVAGIAHSAKIPIFSNIAGHVRQGSFFDLGANYYEVGTKAADISADILGGKSPKEIPVVNYMPQKIAINKYVQTGLKGSWNIPANYEKLAFLIIDQDNDIITKDNTLAATGPQKRWNLELIQYLESPMSEESIQGIRNELTKAGLKEGEDYRWKVRSAQGDIAALPALFDAAQMDAADLYFVLSTPTLQMAVNRIKDKPVVFTMVADPFAAHAGETNDKHLPNITGVYTVGPYKEGLELLIKHFPKTKRIGTLFSPNETNSVFNKDLLVAEGQKLGLTVITIPINSAAEISDASLALLGKKVDIVTQVVDNAISSGFTALAEVSRRQKVPLISFNSSSLKEGANIVIGRDYVTAGEEAARKAIKIMRRISPERIPFTPPKTITMAINEESSAAHNFVIPDSLRQEMNNINKGAKPAHTQAKISPKRIQLIELVEAPAIEESRKGVLAGLENSGLRAGIDYILSIQNAQGDFPTMIGLIDNAVTNKVDLIITITTPVLQSAMQRVRDIPIVFTLALDPLLVGDTGTHDKHRANVAGIYDRSPFEGMMDIIKRVAPEIKTIGTLYAPGEPNSVNFRDQLTIAAKAAGLEVIAVASNSAAEVNDATLALVQRGTQLICQINDNLHGASFPAIVGVARRSHIPIFAFSSKQVEQGAVLTLANDHYDGGVDSGTIAAQVLRGTAPASIPYRGISKTILTINPRRAQEYGLNIPEGMLKQADSVINDSE